MRNVLTLIFVLSLPAAAQQPLTTANFRGGALPIGTDSAETIIHDKDGVERNLGYSLWTIERASVDGRDALRLKVGRSTAYVSLVDATTHATISSAYVASRDTFDVKLRDGVISGWITWGGRPQRPVADSFPTPPFLGVAVDHMIGAFPLRETLSTTIHMYSPWSNQTETTLRVLRSETVAFRGQPVDAWVVELSVPTANGPSNVRTFWVDKASGRRLRRENPLPTGGRAIMVTK